MASIAPRSWPALYGAAPGDPLSISMAVAESGWIVVVVIAMVARGITFSIWWKNVRLSFVLVLGVLVLLVVAWSGATVFVVLLLREEEIGANAEHCCDKPRRAVARIVAKDNFIVCC